MKAKFLLVALMSILTFSTASYAAPKKGVEIKITEKATPAEAQRAREIQARLNEINEMDYNNLSSAQKHEIKREVKSLHKEARQMDGVVFYFGGAGLILLIILLIILL